MQNDIIKLVDGPTLLEILFDEKSRPSMRWLRMQQKARSIPFVKIGHLVRFNPPAVKAALEKKHTVNPR